MKDEEEIRDLMDWLAYYYPGVYRKWIDEKNQDEKGHNDSRNKVMEK